jgi:hypothetical protein
MTVAWFTIEDLGALVRRHRVDDSVSKAIARITRTDLIIVDDIGLLPVSPDAAEGFYRLVDAAYERRSLAVSSNLHSSGFDEIMPKTLATATVDRLLHHAHVVVTQGDSHRLTEATPDEASSPSTDPPQGRSTVHWGLSLSTSGEINFPPAGNFYRPLTGFNQIWRPQPSASRHAPVSRRRDAAGGRVHHPSCLRAGAPCCGACIRRTVNGCGTGSLTSGWDASGRRTRLGRGRQPRRPPSTGVTRRRGGLRV